MRLAGVSLMVAGRLFGVFAAARSGWGRPLHVPDRTSNGVFRGRPKAPDACASARSTSNDAPGPKGGEVPFDPLQPTLRLPIPLEG